MFLKHRMQVRFLSREPTIIEDWSNGKTGVSEALNEGSIPSSSTIADWSSPVARQVHTLEVASSNLASATI